MRALGTTPLIAAALVSLILAGPGHSQLPATGSTRPTAAPTLVSPSTTTATITTTSGLTFSWSAGSTGGPYDFCLSKMETMPCGVTNSSNIVANGYAKTGIMLTYQQLGGFLNTTLWWSVRACKNGTCLNAPKRQLRITLSSGSGSSSGGTSSSLLTWNSVITNDNFPYLTATDSQFTDEIRNRVRGAKLVEIVNSAKNVRPTASEKCSQCHYAYGSFPYQPNVTMNENTLSTAKKIGPGTQVREFYGGTNTATKAWVSAWAAEFESSPNKPLYLKKLIEKWRLDGYREN